MAKELRVTIAMPSRDQFTNETIASLMRTITQTGALVNLTMPSGCYIDDLRNKCWDDAKVFDSDWLLFMDSDNSIDYDGNAFQKMLSLGKDVVSGIYVQKVYPYRPLVYRFTDEGLIQNYKDVPAEPFIADATGCGFLLISRKVMDAFTPDVEARLGRPFNFLRYGQPNMLREDPAFCWRLKELGFDLWFVPEIKMGHHGKQKFTLEHFEQVKGKIEKSQQAVDLGIDGWMTEKELEFLRVTAESMTSVVEIGSWKGRSTKTLLDAGPQVTAVDHWKGSDDIRELAESQDVEAEFDRNVGHYSNLKKIKMTSLEAAKRLNGNKFSMTFLDASHDYESVKSDIEAWLPKTEKIIAGHDYCKNWDGVVRAVNEKFKDRVQTCGTIWYVNLKEGTNA